MLLAYSERIAGWNVNPGWRTKRPYPGLYYLSPLGTFGGGANWREKGRSIICGYSMQLWLFWTDGLVFGKS